MTTDPKPRRYTVEEYFELEHESEEKHDYIDGQIVSMSGGTFEHSVIMTNLIAAVHAKLRGTPCRVFESNLRVAVRKNARYSYPDLGIVCGQPQFDPKDKRRTTIMNPRVVIEVLSPSTESADRGEKFQRYLKLSSLEEYWLVSQDQARVEGYFRQPDGMWLLAYVEGLGSTAVIRSLSIDIPMSEIYAGVDLAPANETAEPEARDS
jgi:Uma2 family endonuclease